MYSAKRRCVTQNGRSPTRRSVGKLSHDRISVWAYQIGPVMDSLCESLEDVDGAGMGEIHSGALAYRQMHDGMPPFEGVAECLRINVVRVVRPRNLVTGTTVEADVDVLDMVTEGEHAGTVVPDTTKHDSPDGIGQSGVASEGVEGVPGLVRRVEVKGVVEERRSDAEELSGDEEGCDTGSDREDSGSGAGRRKEGEGEYTRE